MQKRNLNHGYHSGLEKFKSSLFFKVVDWCLIFSMVSLGFLLDTLAYRNNAYAASPPSISINRKPIANPGPNRTAALFSEVSLDGSASVDPNGDMLNYRWRIITKPKGSFVLLQSPDSFKTKISIDKPGDYAVELVVNDGKVSSDPVIVRISSKNTPPVARAGRDQTVLTGAKVNLDASASSDVDGEKLKYGWEIVQRPSGSTAKLDNFSIIQPSFKPDKPGEYTIRLHVDDDKGNRGDCDVHISTHDTLPIANAGPDQKVRVNDIVSLDGSKSTDIDGSEIRYLWSFTRLPVGSQARLNNPKAVKPTFVADKSGTYIVQLTVGEEDDCWKNRVGLKRRTDHDCATDTVVITTIDDQKPIANAGPDQTIPLKGTVHLDGSTSKDPDGTVITEYSWSFTSLPTSSKATLNNATVSTPDFIADLAGVYVLQLIVKSGGLTSDPDTVIINTLNSKPLANAGPAQQVKQNAIVNLNGNLSSDPDNDPLSYVWSLLSKPDGSSAIIQPVNAINPSFIADLPGDYVPQLIVNDGKLNSDPATTTITAVVPNRAPTITSSPVLTVQVGTAYDYAVIATDPDPNDTLSYALDSAPLGMTINTVSGLINWLPTGTQTGTQSVTVRVNDKAGLFVLQTYIIVVTTPPPVNQPPVITSTAVTSATVGQPYSYDVNATDPDTGDILTYTLTSTIAGMTIDAITGVIAWNPAVNQAGTQVVTVKVQDKAGLVASQSFSIVVSTPTPINQLPVITSTAVTIATVGKSYNYDVEATDPDVGDTLTYTLTTQPTGMSINTTTGVIAWTPAANQTGAHTVMVQVSDGHPGGIVSQTFVIQVAAANTRNLACKARSDHYSTRADQTLSVPVPGVLGNDKFSPSDFLTALKLTDPIRGALSFNNNGAFNYTPNASNQTCTAPPPAGISFVEPLGISLGSASDALINIRGLAKGDFNHDGFSDLAVTGEFKFGWRISVVMGNGDGTFQPPVVLQTFNADVRPSGILAKDIDDDCNLDLFVAVEFTKEILFFKGNPDGSFAAAISTALTTTPQGLQSADLNNDGKLDLVTLNSNNGNPGSTVSVLISNGTGSFLSPVTYPTNAGVTDLALGDVNGDGAPDMVVSSTTNSLSILLNTNTSSGAFATAQQSPVNMSQMSGLYLADFNRDNKLDVVVGGFQCLWTGGNPSGLGTTGSPGCMTFIPGNGDGSFTAPVSTVPNLSPFTSAMAWFPSRGRYSENVAPDVNGDGILDAVFGELPEQGEGNYLHVRLGKGDGTFSTTAWVASAGLSVDAPPPLRNLPDSVSGLGAAVIDDFTGDGVMDIATALGNANGINSGRAALLVGTTPGKFASPGIFPVLEPPFATGGFSGGNVLGVYPMTLGDFTNDGQPELAVVGGFNRLGLMPLAPDGTLGSVKTGIALPAFDPDGVDPLKADFDRDGNLDVAFIGSNQQRSRSLFVVYGDGTGQFGNPVVIPPTANAGFLNIVGGDFNNDGYPDIAAYTGSNPVSIDIFLGTGVSRTFNRVGSAGGSPLGDGSSGGFAMAAADFDQDGILDLVMSRGFNLTNQPAPQQSLFLHGNGDGSFQPATVIAKDILSGFVDFAAADINHDDKLDLIGIAQFSAVHVQLGNGDGTFSTPVLYDTQFLGSAGQVVLADFDWDGHLDIALTMDGLLTNRGLGVLQGRGDGTFAPLQRLAHGVTSRSNTALLTADVNNDGRPDLITGGSISTAQDFTVLLNNSAGLNSCTNTDSFTYQASDGSFDSLPITVRIAIKPSNHPPLVISTPITITNTGQLYVYDVNATDQDASERLAYALTKAPSGMTIEADTGVIEWRPAANQSGPQPVIVRVYDNNGVFAEQSFTLTVAQRVTVPSVVGLTQAAARTAITNVGLTFGTVTTQHSPTVPAGNVISQAPAPGLSVAQSTSINVVVSQGPLVIAGLTSITLNLASPVILVNGSQTFTATGVLGGGGTVAITDGLTWSSSNPGIASISPLGVMTGVTAGTTTITATLGGVTSTFTVTVRATVSGDTVLPTAIITTPTAGAEVTSPINVIGTATDANFFRYELSYAVSGDTNFTQLASGATPVTNGVLGQFDPTLLINDLYDLKLTVFDLGGNQSESVVTVQVSRELKVGLFTLTFQDLNIPLSGIPITINRTYDSRDKGQGDFGVGWRLDIQSLRVRLNREQGTGWLVNRLGGGFGAYVLSPVGEHKVSLTLPGGKVEEFDLTINPTVSPLLPLQSVTASYVPRAGTLGSLVSLEDNDLLVIGDQPGNVTLVTFAGANTYNPKRFRYTSTDGTIIEIDRTKGVEKIQDLNGNTLSFTPLGIVHSSGKSVRFTRDAQGRITDITDPAGNSQGYAYNAAGDLITHTDQLLNVTSFSYNNRHDLLQITDPLNRPAIRNEYDANGRLVAQIDALGNRVAYTHNIGAQEELVTDPRGAIRRVLYDDLGNVTSDEQVVTINGSLVNAVTTHSYDTEGNETSSVDPDGLRTTSTFMGAGMPLSQVIDPNGINLATNYAYNVNHDVTSVTDPAGRIVSLNYDASRNITSVNTPFSGASTAVSNTIGGVVQTQDANGTKTIITRDTFGNVTREDTLDASSVLLRRTDSTYDANGNKLSETLHRTIDGNLTQLTTRFTYNAANRVTAITDPSGNITRIEYNAAGQETARVDSLSRRTTFDYDPVGHRIRTTLPDSTAETSSYDSDGNLISQSDRAGRITTFGYDELNRQVRQTLPDGSVTQTIYTAGGRISATIDAKGNRTDFTYDTAGRQTTTTLPEVADGVNGGLAKPQASKILNKGGTPDSTIDPNGRQTAYQYDASGRPTKITFADGSFITQQYNALGKLTNITNEEGQSTNFSYDGLGRLIATSGLKGEATYTYDEAGNLITQTDALGRVTRLHYDLLNRLIGKVYPGGETESITYDTVGNVATVTNANGQITTFEYDEVNQLTSKTLPDTSVISYSYTATGQRAKVIDSRGTTVYTYDALDRLTSVTHPTGQTVSYSHDANGNLTSLNSPSASVTYTYDALNRLTNVAAPEGQSQYSYDLAGNRVRFAAANGILTDFQYNNRNRPTQLTHSTVGGTVVQSFTNVFSPAGRRTKVTELDGSVENYTYDSQGRLQSEVRTGTNAFNIAHAYDSVGNRTQTMKDGALTTFTYDVNDRLLNDGTANYTYDVNGNLTKQVAGSVISQYSYDSENRLTSFVDAAGTTQFTYDADGNRVQSIAPNGTTQFLVDTENNTGLSQVLEERDGTGSLKAGYTYGAERLAMVRGGGSHFYQHDIHGNVRSLTDSNAAVTDSYQYDGYGRTVSSLGSTINPYRYSGERLDEGSGLYQLRARYYQPNLGRFMSRDPFGGRLQEPVSLHRYLYANSDPVNGVDPTGLSNVVELTIAQGIQNVLRAVKGTESFKKGCKAIGTLGAVRSAIFFSTLGISLLLNIYSDTSLGFVISAIKPGGTDPYELKKIDFRHYVTKGGYFQIATESVNGTRGGLSIPYSDIYNSSISGGFNTPRIDEVKACGVSVFKADSTFRVKFTGPATRIRPGVKAPKPAQFSIVVGFDLTFFQFVKLGIPTLTLKLNTKGGAITYLGLDLGDSDDSASDGLVE